MANINQSSVCYLQKAVEISTHGRGTTEITQLLQDFVERTGINVGLCHVFVQHTSASLMICENADPDVRVDLETYMSHLVPDGDPMFIHVDEGSDDMPAHVRSVLTQAGLTIPIQQSILLLGTWQGVYLWEHRMSSHGRKIIITVHGHAGHSQENYE